MENPKYIQVMRQTASDFEGIGQGLFKIANKLEKAERYNPQSELFSLNQLAEIGTISIRNLAARTVYSDKATFYAETASVLGIKVEEFHDWIKITAPGILPKRNQKGVQPPYLLTPLRQALVRFQRENPMEKFGACVICIVHKYDVALGTLRVRDYDNIETKRYLDVIESQLLTNDSGLLCSVLQCTEMTTMDSTEFYIMTPDKLRKWLETREKGIPEPLS